MARQLINKHSISKFQVLVSISIVVILVPLLFTGMFSFGNVAFAAKITGSPLEIEQVTETVGSKAKRITHFHPLSDLDSTKCPHKSFLQKQKSGFKCVDVKKIGTERNIFVNVKDFGAVGDGTNNDTPAIKSALKTLDQGLTTGNFVIFLPAGIYRIEETLAPPNSASNWTLMGEGKLSSVLRWDGPKGIPVIKLTNAQGVVLKDFGIFGNSQSTPSHGIQVHRGPGVIGTRGAPGRVYFENIFIGKYSNDDAIDNGITYTADQGHDGNNEQGHFTNIHIQNVNKYGLSFEHSNSLWHRIYGGSIEADEAAINNIGPGGSQGGSFQLVGTALGAKQGGYLFRLGASLHAISIIGATAEGSAGLLFTPNTITTGGNSIQIIGGSYKLSSSKHGHPTVLYDSTGSASLTMSDAYFAQEVWWKLPSSGSMVSIENVRTVTTKLEYNNEVYIDRTWNEAGPGGLTMTNLGNGKLVITHGSGSFNGIGNKQRFQNGDTTPSVQGWDYFEAHYTDPNGVTITDFDDGYLGKEFTLYSNTGNIIIKHSNDKIWLKNGIDLKLDAISFIKFRKVSVPFGNRWVEVD